MLGQQPREGSCEIVVFVLILRSYARLQESDWDFVAGVVETVFESSGAVSPDPQVSTIPPYDSFNCGRARFEYGDPIGITCHP